MDITGFTQKVISLEAELQDISSQESKDEASLAKVKKQLRDLEAKVKDQEEELDEQAGSIQMLEQVPGGMAKGGQVPGGVAKGGTGSRNQGRCQGGGTGTAGTSLPPLLSMQGSMGSTFVHPLIDSLDHYHLLIKC